MTRPCSGAASAASASSFGGSALGFEPAFFLFLGMSESYAKIAAMVQERSTLDATAFALMKWISAEMSFVMQAAIRSIIATAALTALGLHFFVRGERFSALQCWAICAGLIRAYPAGRPSK